MANIVVLRIRSKKFDFQTASQSEIAFKMAKRSNMVIFFRSEYPVVGTLNLCRKTPETLEKESG